VLILAPKLQKHFQKLGSWIKTVKLEDGLSAYCVYIFTLMASGWPGETGLQPRTTEIHTDEIGPMGLLDSLTLMVAQSSDGNPYGHKSMLMPSTSQQALIEQTNMVQDQQADTLDPSDLPQCNDENQSGMFFGLMGA
jgi:hypothetical protein